MEITIPREIVTVKDSEGNLILEDNALSLYYHLNDAYGRAKKSLGGEPPQHELNAEAAKLFHESSGHSLNPAEVRLLFVKINTLVETQKKNTSASPASPKSTDSIPS